MDERRDLVDREELRRRLEENFSRRRLSAALWGVVLTLLDAMPAVEWTRGWTRDEVLAELDADPDAVCEYRDTFTGNWLPISRSGVKSWGEPDAHRPNVRMVRVAPEPEWVPLTQLVGRTIDGSVGEVAGWNISMCGAEWWTRNGTRYRFPEGTLNLETGQVAVRPKAAT